MDVYGRKPTNEKGEYFRANVWGWRPIHYLCFVANQRENLNYDMTNWGSNDGAGLTAPTKCRKLALAIEKMVNENNNLQNPEDKIYIAMGMWVEAGTGRFVQDTEDLDEVYPTGTIMYNSFVDAKGRHIESAYSIDREFLNEWLEFLRNCGGFKIW